MVIYDNVWRDLPSLQNRPLYVTASIREVKLRRVVIDTGSSLNIISLSVPGEVGVPRDKITRQPIVVSGFRGNCTYTLGFVKLSLTVRYESEQHIDYMLLTLIPRTTSFLEDPGSNVRKSFLLHTTSV